ncbi:MAG TPA: hypothetical protein VF939_12510 [Puia sp.]
MGTIILFLLSQSVLLPLIAGLVRVRRIDKSYQPFFIFLVIGFLTEIISFILIQGFYKSNIIVANIYDLVEWTLIAWQFHVWGFLKQKKQVFYGLLVLSILVWVTENLLFRKITDFSPYFRILYCFFIVLLSVNKINFMITHDNQNLFRNPRFVICLGFIIYFLYMIIYYWALQISKLGDKLDISISIMFLVAYVNTLTNVIYAIAILLIPAPQKFTLN